MVVVTPRDAPEPGTASPILNPDGSWGMTPGQFAQLLKEIRTVIRNLTPHPINVYRRDDNDLALVHFGPDEVLPVDGPPVRLAMKEHDVWNDGTVRYTEVEYGAPTDLPPKEEGVWLVVSLPVALALYGRGRDDLLVPYREVRDERGQVAGCRTFARPW